MVKANCATEECRTITFPTETIQSMNFKVVAAYIDENGKSYTHYSPTVYIEVGLGTQDIVVPT